MTILASELNKRVTLQKTVKNTDELGAEYGIDKKIIGIVWAKIDPISNRKIKTNNENITETILFTLRPNKYIDVDDQIIFQGRSFSIRAVDRTKSDRVIITGEVNSRYDRA